MIREEAREGKSGASDEVLGQILELLAAQLLHDLLEFLLKNFNNLVAALAAHRADTKHRRAAEEGEFRSTSDGDGNIGS